MKESSRSVRDDKNHGSAGERKRNRDRLVAAAALVLASIAFGAAAKVSQEPVPDAPVQIPTRGPAPNAAPDKAGNPGSLAGAAQLSAGSVGPVYFTAQLDRGAVLQGGDGLVNLELAIRAEASSQAVSALRAPIDLVVVLDRSGSMSGAPLQHAVASVSELIAPLGPNDRFSLVSYASNARVDVPLARADAQAKRSWLRVLRSLRSGGGTNMALGLDFSNAEVSRQRDSGRALRVILLSDGHANEGDDSYLGLRTRAAAAVRGEYVLTTVGVGQGFDQQLMAGLADAGTGNFYYVSDLAQLGDVFAGEFASARETVAHALEVSIHPGPGVEILDAAGYPLEMSEDGSVRFRPGALFAGQDRRIWVTLRADTRQLGELTLDRVSLKYLAEGEQRELTLSPRARFACVEGVEAFQAAVDQEAWSRNVARDGLNRMKQMASRHLGRGAFAEARSIVSSFAAKAERENAVYGNRLVAESIEAANAMAMELDAVIAKGAAAQNSFSKKLAADGLDGRRQGAKYDGYR